jgi:type I site-specific restriction endonuclease
MSLSPQRISLSPIQVLSKSGEKIDALLAQSGWLVQDREDMNLTASDGIAVREFKLEKGHGFVDYLLFVHGNALGVVQAKPAGYSFTSVEFQAKKMGLRENEWVNSAHFLLISLEAYR